MTERRQCDWCEREAVETRETLHQRFAACAAHLADAAAAAVGDAVPPQRGGRS